MDVILYLMLPGLFVALVLWLWSLFRRGPP